MDENTFSSYEEDLNIIIDQISRTINTFSTLSREQAENAIIEASNKIKSGQKIINDMENLVISSNNNNHFDNDKDLNSDDLIGLNKKILKCKNEFNIILNKFNNTQNEYIKKKTANALIDDITANNKTNPDKLIDNEEKISKKEVQKDTNVFEGNVRNISNVNDIGIEKRATSDDVFNALNVTKEKKKRKMVIITLIVIVIISIGIFLVFFSI